MIHDNWLENERGIVDGVVDRSHCQSCVFGPAALPEAFEAAGTRMCPKVQVVHVSRPRPA